MNGMSYTKAVFIIIAIAGFVLAFPLITYIGSYIWSVSYTSYKANEVEDSLVLDMSLVSAKKVLRSYGANIYEFSAEECDDRGKTSYPSYETSGGPCVSANIDIRKGFCSGNRVHARLFFDIETKLEKWETINANSYL